MNLIELSIINPPRFTVGNKVEKSQLAIFTDTLCATIYGLKEIDCMSHDNTRPNLFKFLQRIGIHYEERA